MNDPPRLPVVDARPAEAWRTDGAVSRIARIVPDEIAIGLSYDSRPHVVLMGAPADIEDLAIGFSITEGIAACDEIENVRVAAREEGLAADILLKPGARAKAAAARARTMEGRSSCGLCGVQHLKDAARNIPAVTDGFTLTHEAVQAALANLETEQEHGRVTRAMHAAGWADQTGALLHVREDVGRHNALDKVIGAAARAGRNPAAAFVIVTSRCSYEMVEKCAFAGVSVIAAISAPTALAIRKAEESGITLIALARADGHVVFTRGDRIRARAPA